MSSVREFGRAITQPLGAPVGPVDTYTDVPFIWARADCRPVGLIRIRSGKTSWTALVEVKTGAEQLEAAQLETYLDVAKRRGFDVVLTISNETAPATGQHPTTVDKRKLKKVSLHHYSWSQILAAAATEKEHRAVGDPDQARILGELIRYLDHPGSGALGSDVEVPDGVATSTMRATETGDSEVAALFGALLRYASLHLGSPLDAEASPVPSQKRIVAATQRTHLIDKPLAGPGTLRGAIHIPNSVGNLEVTADLRAGKVTCHVEVAAPRSGKSVTRLNWLVRQLKNAPDRTRVEAFVAHQRVPSAGDVLRNIRENPAVLIANETEELRVFRVSLDHQLGVRRGRGRGSFIDSVLEAVDVFYAVVMKNLKAWGVAPPVPQGVGETAPASMALSSLDAAEEVLRSAATRISRTGERQLASGEPDQDDPGLTRWQESASDNHNVELA
jgi:hypothetical protein